MKRKRQGKRLAGILLVLVIAICAAVPVAGAEPVYKEWTQEKGEMPTRRFKIKTRCKVTLAAKVLDQNRRAVTDSALCALVLFHETASRFVTEQFFFVKDQTSVKQSVILYPGIYTLDADCDTKYKVALKINPSPGLSASKMTLKPGLYKKLKLYGAEGTVKWKSSNKKVAVVSSKGKVLARKQGTCVIAAKCADGRIFRCKVTVK